MKKIIFTSYLGFPNPNTGGANKIIYEILNSIDYSQLNPIYISYQFQKHFNFHSQLFEIHDKNLNLKKQLGQELFYKSSLYRRVVKSKLYLEYYYKRIDKTFLKFLGKYSNANYIHSHDTLSGYYFSKINGPKKILTIHSKGSQTSEIRENLIPNSYLYKKTFEFLNRERKAFEESEIITFPSLAAKNIFLEELCLDNIEKDIRIIYNGVNLNYINNIKKEETLFDRFKIRNSSSSIKILNVAQLIQPKNVNILIEAVNILVNKLKKDVILINIGTGYLLEQLKILINKYGLEHNAYLLGSVNNEYVIKFMKSCDYFIMTSKKVIFDFVILEAMASGLCILASNEGGNKEIIQDGKNGYLIEKLTPEYVVKKLLNIEKSKVTANALLTAEMFSSDKMYIDYNKLYL